MIHDNWLTRRVRVAPTRLALVGEGQRYTWAELAAAAQERAGQLARYGGAGERVAILAGNSVELYLWLLACQQAGLQLVLLNIRLSAQELQRQLVDCAATVILTDDDRFPLACAIRDGIDDPVAVATLSELRALEPAEPTIVEGFDLDAVTTILYTSGTTGDAKGVLQTFGNHWHSAVGSMLNLGLEPNRDAWICAVPLFHISGFSIIMRSLIYGIPVYLQPRFDPQAMNQLLLDGTATLTSVVPQMLRALVKDLGEQRYPDSVRCVLLGGGFVDDATLASARAQAIPVVFSFGMTETASQCIALPLADVDRKRGSAGLPLPGVDVRIASAAPGEVGVIEIRSQSITVGYLNQPERYAAAFTPDGWFSTGDLGYLDDDGYLYVVSRLADMIISGGENIFPAEVEQVLAAFPGVVEAAVVGRADDHWGYVPVAYVVRRDEGLTEAALLHYAREHLAHYKVPVEVLWIAELPRTASGKVRRLDLVPASRDGA